MQPAAASQRARLGVLVLAAGVARQRSAGQWSTGWLGLLSIGAKRAHMGGGKQVGAGNGSISVVVSANVLPKCLNFDHTLGVALQ